MTDTTDTRIDWQPFSPATFARAKAENRLVFALVTTTWCHWCRVMDRETFSHPDVIAALNRHYIAVRIDRDERPDLDRRLQESVQLLRVGGGWPLCAIFTPAGELAFGTTYMPAHDDHLLRRRGLAGLLDELAEKTQTDAAKVAEMSKQMLALLDARQSPGHAEGAAGTPLAADVLARAVRLSDQNHGGIRTENAKFPHATLYELGLIWSEMAASEGHELRPEVREFISFGLEQMALSGLCDQLGDGFHRYANDSQWALPEFEKTATDNAALLRTYALAARVLGDPFFANVARNTATWMLESLLATEGGFYSSVAADPPTDAASEAGEFSGGRYYTWTLRDVETELPEELADAFCLYFGVHKRGDFPAPRQRENVLRVAASIADVADELGIGTDDAERRIEQAAVALRRVRRERPAPFVDRRIFVDGNAEAAHALLLLARLMPDDAIATAAREQALRALDRVLADAYQPGLGFLHEIPTTASGGAVATEFKLLADQAWAILALIEAWSATGKRAYLDAATDTVAFANRFLWDEFGGYRDVLKPRDADADSTSAEPPIAGILRRPITDSPTASGNGVMLRALVRLGIATNDERYHERARTLAESLAGLAKQHGFLAATFVLGAAELEEKPATVVVAGRSGDAATSALFDAARRAAPPWAMVFPIDPKAEKKLAAAHGAELVDGAPAVYICVGERCLAPKTHADEIADADFRVVAD